MDFATALTEAINHSNSGVACKLIWEFRIKQPNRWGSTLEIICESETHVQHKLISIPVIIQAKVNVVILEMDAMIDEILPH